jgi:hypothetical protein
MENNNSKANVDSPPKPGPRDFRLIDVFVILFCITGAAFSLNLFRLDLFQSIALQNKKPMGSVTVKYNNVQRRFSDRVLWSRLAVESPVYLGDLIRVADYSAATLHINDDVIDLNENTLIRIRASADGEGRIIIDLGSGSLSISGAVDSGGGIALNVMGRVVAPQAGTTLSASAGEDGMTLQVNEGSVTITEEDGQSRLLVTGGNLTLDTEGVEQAVPSAVVTLPRPNARFIKNGAQQPLNVRFAWNTANIDQKQPLRLEIAAGPNFTRLARSIESVDSASAALEAGTWYWRLSYQNTVLSSGQFTIADAAVTALASPIQNSLFRYRDNLPAVRFEWQPVEGASYYILEAGLTPDVSNPLVTRQTAVASFVEPGLEAGTWYWRVKPVFSALYEGSAAFSPAASFRVERIDEPAAAGAGDKLSVTLVLPESAPVPAVVEETPPETETVKLPETNSPPPATADKPVLLPEVRNPVPVAGQRIQFEDIRTKRRIDFSWSPVEGADAYIFTLYQQGSGTERRRIIQTEPLQRTAWTLSQLALLDRGTFVWQVEAVSINRGGSIERRGRIAENTFIVDIPVSRNLEIEEIGELYEQ